MSAWKASASRSNCSLMCSSNVCGTPIGTGMLSGATVDAFIAICRRRSISRTSSAYCSSRTRSACGTCGISSFRLPLTESRMLASRSRRALRISGELPSPNIRSNTTCGLISIGSGRLGADQEMVLV